MTRKNLFFLFPFFILTSTFLFIIQSTAAANPDGDLRIEINAAYNLVVDSNVETPATYAPTSFYIGAEFCNDGTNTLTEVVANVGNFDESGSSHTPGIYPARASGDGPNPNDPVDTGRTFDQAHPHLAGTPGTYSYTHEGSANDATRIVGTLLPGECKTQYWLVSYPRRGNAATTGDNLGDAVWGATRLPEDDLWLAYDVWVSANDGGTNLLANTTQVATMRNEISAMANKIWPNGDNKVPDEYKAAIDAFLGWTTDVESGGNAAYPGETIQLEGVWYDLGNVNKGFDNNGDFVPDYNAWMQPVGDPAFLNSDCFRLVRTYGIVIVKLNDGTEHLIPFENQLYFENLPQNNTGAVGLVFYEYLVLEGACVGSLTPYQEVASGSDNEKFNGDFGVAMPPLIALAPEIDLSKTVTPTVAGALPTPLTYTVSITNSSPITIGKPALGMPLVIQDSIPANTTYVSGTAAANVNINGGTIGTTIYYSTDNGSTWTTTDPGASTTDIQWWLDEALPAGAGGSLTFQVTVPGGYSKSIVSNTAGVSLGSGGVMVEDDAHTVIPGPNSIGDTVWEDNGSGGGTSGDGTQNGTEGGLANITVSLYLDRDDNGLLDPDVDLVIGSTLTNGSGAYSFNNLADGNYIAVVDDADPNLPNGYVPSTTLSHAVDLDAAGLSGTAVDYLDADFGLAPILNMTKLLGSGSPVYEGDLITYTISITNSFYSGGGPALASEYYATTSESGSLFSAGGSAANLTGAPDGTTYDSTESSPNGAVTAAEVGLGSGFSIPSCGNITKVEAVYYIGFSGFSNDNLQFDIFDQTGANRWTSGLIDANATYGSSTSGIQPFVFDVTSGTGMTDWATWDNTPANEVRLGVGAQKVSANDPFTLNVDAFGIRLTVDDTTCSTVTSSYDPATSINPLPLTDTYDPTKLTFVSATVAPDSTLPAGTLTWNNLGPLNIGDSKSLVLTYRALEPFSNSAELITNTATIDSATLGNGKDVNDVTDAASATLQPTGSIGDTVWRDGDSDGVIDGGEFGVANVVVSLTPPAGVDLGNGAGVAITTTTDLNGAYLFDGLKNSGSYVVAVDTSTLPGGAGTAVNTYDEDDGTIAPNSSTTVVLDHDATDGSDEHLSADFGYTLLTTIDGTIWHDINQNGAATPDSGESYLEGVTVTIKDDLGSAMASTTTDANGYFEFALLYNGDFTVEVDSPYTGDMGSGSWSQTFDSDGTGTPDEAGGTVVTGGYGRVDFSYVQTGVLSIGDTVYYDWNGNGAQDSSDEGVANIMVTLYQDSNGDGLVDPNNDPIITTTTTDANGFYTFTNLPANNYIVDVAESDSDFPALFTQTADPDSDIDGQGVVPLTVVTDTIDFGYQPLGTGSIGDTVWYDKNGDAIQSGAQEIGLANVTVELWADFNGDGTYVLVKTTTTDTDGTYLFDELPDGDYEVRVDTADSDIPNDPFGNRYVATTDTTVSTILTGGSSFLDADFGFAALGAIGDTIFWDANGNGDQGWDENGIVGVTVTLSNSSIITDTDGTVYPVGTYTQNDVTDSNGNYLFTALPPGGYTITVDTGGPINGAAQTADPNRDGVTCTDTTYPSMPACDNAMNTSVTYGTGFMGADFGYQAPGAFGDYIWFDQDGDGIQDGGEPGLANVVITATTAADVTINGVNYPTGTTITTTTDFDGYYSFDNLISNGASATWTVTVEQPANTAVTYDPDGSLNTSTTLVINTGGDVVEVGGTACTDCFLDVDFGFELDGPYSLTGSVCLEDKTSTNGLCGDGTDIAAASYTVYLYNDSGDYLGAAQTDSSGVYTFTNLINDGYVVSMVPNVAPLQDTDLTTTSSDVPETITDGGTGIYQTATVSGGSVSGYDFAFVSPLDYDYGDLPSPYKTMLTDGPSGARHSVPSTPTLYLGATIDTESDGVPSIDANSDGSDEDGVTPVNFGSWTDGTNGGTVSVDVTGAGWLVGWIDFNDDGDLTDDGEFIISQAVTTGTHVITFDIPTGSMSGGATRFYSRFRLFESEPSVPILSFAGTATNGEVEDHVMALLIDLELGKSVNDATPNYGDTITYTLAIVNNGPDAATGVTITDTLPVGLSFVSSTPSQGSYAGDVWTVGALSNGQNETLLITAVVTATGTITNTAQVATADQPDTDSTPGNDVSTEDDQDSAAITVAAVTDLELSKSVNTATPLYGDTLTYTVTIVNDGPDTATNVTISDTLPIGLSFASSSASQGSYAADVWTVGTLTLGQSETLTLTAVITGTGTITNTAQVATADQPDTDSTPGNDVSSEDDQDDAVVTVQAGTVSGHLYIDTNGNGTQDGGEPDLDNVDVVITDSLGITQTVMTDANGDWSATVPPGATSADVDETDPDYPAGYTQTEGDDPTTITAVAGTNTDAGNDGYYLPGTVSGHLYIDANGNGTQDGGEPDLDNVDVVITDSLGITQTVTTDANGDWTASVPPGSTTADVDETDTDYPTGYVQTEGNDPTMVTAVAGSNTDAGNDGYYLGATASGHLYIDTNGNGTQDGGEPDLDNVDVVITDSLGITQTVTTDANGDWSATVPPGSTTADVDETDSDYPAGYTQTEGNDPTTITAVAGTDTDAGNDGYYLAGTISGHLYIDTNGNGTQDGGEPDLDNVDVVITDSLGITQTVMTDANGDWSASVPPGSTSADVDETDSDYPTGHVQTEGTDPTTVTVTAGATADAGNDGYYLAGIISGHLYIDTNGNGTQDGGEPDLDNVDVVITDSLGVTQTVTTDANGDWSATVPPGSTSADVDETDPDYPTGYTQTEGDDPTTVSVTAGATADAGNDGYYLPGTVSGHLYIDTNGNGTQDGGELDLDNVDVVITDSLGITQTVTTDANGDWSASVPPGSTSADVDETDPDYPTGYTQTEGDDPTTITAVAGTNTSAGNDGYYLPSTVSGHLYIDTNGNGTQDGSEPDLENVDVVITDSLGVTQTVTTDANGDWSATVPPGSTSADVDETDPDYPTGYTQTEGDDPTTVTAVAGVNTDAGNDGYEPLPATIGDLVWIDHNLDGVQDSGEPGFPGITVTLTLSGTGVISTTITDASGLYTFTNLIPGDYSVTFSQPPNYLFTTPDQGSDAADSDADETTGATPFVSIGSGDVATDWDAGLFAPLSFGGFVWDDADSGGTQTTLESGIAGAQAELLIDDGSGTFIPATTITGTAVLPQTTLADGLYQFDNLPPGDYRVRITPPGDYTPTYYQVGTDNDDSEDDSNIASEPVAGTYESGTFTLEHSGEPVESGAYPGDDADDTAVDDNSNLTIDMGFFLPVAIGNTIWNDNGAGGGTLLNGVRDGAEAGISNVTVELYRDGDTPGVDAPFFTTTSDTDGNYLFDAIPQGSYVIHIPADQFVYGAPLSSFVSSTGSGGDDDNDDNVDENGIDHSDPTMNGISTATIVLTHDGEPTAEPSQGSYPGTLDDDDVNMTVDFGFFELLTLGNLVWLDLDQDGIIDGGEPGATGVVVNLLDASGNPVFHPLTGLPMTTTTDINGRYQFIHLYPGEYVIEIDAVNFQSGGALAGYWSSEGFVDPDNNNDLDDNGVDEGEPWLYGVRSQPVRLDYNDEPDGGDDTDDNNNTNLTVDMGFAPVPTAVTLTSFTATHVGGSSVRIDWATAEELDSFGFRIYRNTVNDFASATEIHFEPSAVSGGTGPGAQYVYTDNSAPNGIVYYWLVDVETDGDTGTHGPVAVSVNPVYQIYVPIVVRP